VRIFRFEKFDHQKIIPLISITKPFFLFIFAALAPSLRAKRSNPAAKKKDWIASSQELLAMTELATPT
jgi:hypothetical protein